MKKEELAKLLRDPYAIAHAWQAMEAVLEGGLPLQYDPVTMDNMYIARDVLCWVLGHNHPTEFGEFLNHVLQQAKQEGFTFMKPERTAEHLDLLPGKWGEEVQTGKVSYAHALQEIKAFHTGLLRSFRVSKKACPRCGMMHGPEEPHDPSSKLFKSYTLAHTGLLPTWEDAVADCPEPLQGLIAAELNKLGSYPKYVGLTPKITKALRRCMQTYHKGKTC